jgi:ElaB/YqjD/DUF883 family membrane-anchored ribosome-binding protein
MTQEKNDPAALEQEAMRTRRQIDETVHEIEHRLSPGQLLDQVLGTVREHGGELGRNHGGQIKDNPAALVLTGVGLAWLTLGQGRAARRESNASPMYSYSETSRTAAGDSSPSTASSVKSSIEGAANSVKDAASATKERYRDAKHSVADTAHKGKAKIQDAKLHLHESAHQLSDRARYRMERSSQQAKDLYDDHPLLIGGLGLALGAALGAWLPHTETEDELVGERSDDIADKLKAEASDQYDHVRDKAKRAVEDAGDTLKPS